MKQRADMSREVFYLDDHSVFVVSLRGRIDGVHLRGLIGTVLTSDQWEPGHSTLWDGRGIAELVISPEDLSEIGQLATKLSDRRGTGKTAVVTIRDIDLMIAELLQHTITFFGPFRIFHRLRDAAHWLDVPMQELWMLE